MLDMMSKKFPITHARYRYRCLSCMNVVTVVIPLRATLGLEYDCRQCARRTPWEVEYIPPDAPGCQAPNECYCRVCTTRPAGMPKTAPTSDALGSASETTPPPSTTPITPAPNPQETPQP